MRKKIIFIIIGLLILGGIESFRELNELAIVSGIAVDIDEKGNYKITAQILNPKGSGKESGSTPSSDSSKVIEYESSAETVQLALRTMIYESPKKLYLGHMELLILSEEVVKKNIKGGLDFFLRDSNANKEFIVIVADGCKASDVTSILTPLEQDPVKNIVESIKTTSKFSGKVTENHLGYYIAVILEDGVELTLPSIKIQGSIAKGEEKENIEKVTSDAKLIVSNLAYFKKDRFCGYLDEKDSISHNMMNGKITRSIVEGFVSDEEVAAELYDFDVSYKPKVKDGKYILDFKLNAKAIITEVTGKDYIDSEEEVEKFEKILSEQLKKDLDIYVANTKDVYNSDIIGVETIFRKRLNKEYKKIKKRYNENIDEFFKDVDIRVKVEIHLDKEGEVIDSGKKVYG